MSGNMRDDLLKIGCPKEKIVTHYYGTDTKKFFYKRTYLENREVNFLILSGLTEKKGHLFLLRAFLLATSQTKVAIKLVIAGDGLMKPVISEFIQKHHMQNVSLTGGIIYASKTHLDLFRTADIFIHPSITSSTGDKEGIPGAIIEAMSSGLPTISTYHAGIPSVIENGETGILVEENNVQELADAIVYLAEQAELRERLGKAGQAHVLTKFDLFEKEKELEEIYDSFASKKSS